MKKVAVVAMGLLVVVAAAGCYGPQMATRGVDDWLNEAYTGTPWLYGNVVSAALIGMVNGLTWMVDGIAINVYYFWIKDAQPFGSGKGTAYQHKAVAPSGK